MRNFNIKPPQIIISLFLITLVFLAYALEMNLVILFNESLVKLVMNGVLVLSLIPMLNVGAGMNFGLPVGIIGGLLGMCLAVNFRMTGLYGFFAALLFSLVICAVLGWIYGLILNRVKGREEIAGTFIGFSFIPLMNFFSLLITFHLILFPISLFFLLDISPLG
jgi:simple sugar transport system permease protein